MKNIEALFEKLVEKRLIKKEIEILIIGFLRIENFKGDLRPENIDLVVKDYTEADMASLVVYGNVLTGWFKDKFITFMADTYYFGAKKNCFSSEDIVRIGYLYQLLHDHILLDQSCLSYAN